VARQDFFSRLASKPHHSDNFSKLAVNPASENLWTTHCLPLRLSRLVTVTDDALRIAVIMAGASPAGNPASDAGGYCMLMLPSRITFCQVAKSSRMSRR
jgi:hypothetical protein